MSLVAADPMAEDATIGRHVLEIVERLVAELGGPKARGDVSLDDALDRDLGIGSLERVELLLRLEKEFGVRLPDAVMADAVTPRDLVTAIGSSSTAPPEALPRAVSPLPPGMSAPASARTLNEVLRWHAERAPERVHIYLREEDAEERPISYGRLWQQAASLAAGLHDWGLRAGGSGGAHAAHGGSVLRAPSSACCSRAAFRCRSIRRFAPIGSRSMPRARSASSRNAGARVLLTFRQAMPVADSPSLPRSRARRSDRRRANGETGRRAAAAARRARRSRLDPVHLGQHRRAEGRAALAREPARQHPRHRRARSRSARATSA